MLTLQEFWSELTPSLQTFYNVWEKVRREKDDIPHRRDLALHHLKRLAPYFTILEHTAPGQMRIKISGTEIDAQFGRNLTGANILDIAEAEAGKAMIGFHEALLSAPCAGFAHDILVAENGKRLNAKYLILPMKNRFGDRVLCASLCDAEIEGFSAAPNLPSPRITQKEFQRALHLDIGYGLPDYTSVLERGYILERKEKI